MLLTKGQKGRYMAVFGFVVASLLVYFLASGVFDKSPEEQLQLLSKGLNEKCPMMVDDITRLDSTQSEGLFLTYFYTLKGVEKSMGDFSAAESEISGQILEQIKTTPDMKALRDIHVTFRYVYRDQNGEDLFDLTIVPEQYN